MTDMTNVSPVSEGEMSQIQAMFKRAADTIIAYSSLYDQVQSLQKQVNELQGMVNRYRNQIDTQDEALYKLRREGRSSCKRVPRQGKRRMMQGVTRISSSRTMIFLLGM